MFFRKDMPFFCARSASRGAPAKEPEEKVSEVREEGAKSYDTQIEKLTIKAAYSMDVILCSFCSNLCTGKSLFDIGLLPRIGKHPKSKADPVSNPLIS
jgi:hypothetical protein